MTAWISANPYIVLPYLVPCTQVAGRTTPTVVACPSPATCVKGINHLRRAVRRVFSLIRRNSNGDDRAASPGWGGTAPSKSLIGLHRLETETTAHIDTRSRIGISNGQSRRYLTEHGSASVQIAKPELKGLPIARG